MSYYLRSQTHHDFCFFVRLAPCRAFISEHKERLRALRNNVVMHIATLREFAVISLAETAQLLAHTNATLGTCAT